MSSPTGWEDDPATETSGKDDEDAPSLYYGSLPKFMREFFIPMFPRDVTHTPGLTWCPEWWLHPEATYRLDSLWRSWEHLRLDAALGTSTWLREHLDHHLPQLLSDAGPFKGCSIKNGHTAARHYFLPTHEPPAGLYLNETESSRDDHLVRP